MACYRHVTVLCLLNWIRLLDNCDCCTKYYKVCNTWITAGDVFSTQCWAGKKWDIYGNRHGDTAGEGMCSIGELIANKCSKPSMDMVTEGNLEHTYLMPYIELSNKIFESDALIHHPTCSTGQMAAAVQIDETLPDCRCCWDDKMVDVCQECSSGFFVLCSSRLRCALDETMQSLFLLCKTVSLCSTDFAAPQALSLSAVTHYLKISHSWL